MILSSKGASATTGSTGASASMTSSVISASEGSVHVAPESLFGFIRPVYGLGPAKLSWEPSIPKPRQSSKLTPISLATSIGSSIIKPSLPSTRIWNETFDKSAPGANSKVHEALACPPVEGSAPTASS